MKILHILSGLKFSFIGGISTYVRSIANSQRENGDEVWIYGQQDNIDFPIHVEKTSKFQQFTLCDRYDEEALADFEQFLNEQQFDIIHIHSIFLLPWGCAEVLKKDGGANLKSLSNKEKTLVIDALRPHYKLKDLLKALSLAKSSYCYQRVVMAKPDKYAQLKKDIQTIFAENFQRYGYRRICCCLKKNRIRVAEKVVRRLMRLEGLRVYTPRKRKYSSYVGEVSPSVPNLLQRDFHAELPNQKWLTDITEFSIPAGKVYLSPIIDCFDGMPVSWRIGCSPSAQMANAMLKDAIASLRSADHPIIHSDRGGHYRWPEWIKITSDAGLTRSMSKKGCSPDNSACEGFFGRLKNEMFYGKSWEGFSLAQFMASLDSYMQWYKEKRIKVSLGGLSPLEYREALGLT